MSEAKTARELINSALVELIDKVMIVDIDNARSYLTQALTALDAEQKEKERLRGESSRLNACLSRITNFIKTGSGDANWHTIANLIEQIMSEEQALKKGSE